MQTISTNIAFGARTWDRWWNRRSIAANVQQRRSDPTRLKQLDEAKSRREQLKNEQLEVQRQQQRQQARLERRNLITTLRAKAGAIVAALTASDRQDTPLGQVKSIGPQRFSSETHPQAPIVTLELAAPSHLPGFELQRTKRIPPLPYLNYSIAPSMALLKAEVAGSPSPEAKLFETISRGDLAPRPITRPSLHVQVVQPNPDHSMSAMHFIVDPDIQNARLMGRIRGIAGLKISATPNADTANLQISTARQIPNIAQQVANIINWSYSQVANHFKLTEGSADTNYRYTDHPRQNMIELYEAGLGPYSESN